MLTLKHADDPRDLYGFYDLLDRYARFDAIFTPKIFDSVFNPYSDFANLTGEFPYSKVTTTLNGQIL